MTGTCPLCHEGVFGHTDGVRSYTNGRTGEWTHWKCIYDEGQQLNRSQSTQETA